MFGLNATMNAMNYFGCHADWELAYSNVSEDYRNRMSNAFPFKVHWTPLQDIVDKYKEKYGGRRAEKFWVGFHAITADKINNYDAVCLIQGDNFLCYDVTSIFKAVAMANVVVVTEHYDNLKVVEDLPFGREEEVYNRGHCALTDQLIFANKKHKDIFEYCAKSQLQESVKGETNHPIIALNRAICKYTTKQDVIALERSEWCYRKGLFSFPLRRSDKRLYNNRNLRIKGIHNKLWIDGVKSELATRKDDRNMMIKNIQIVRDLMNAFNSMTLETKVEVPWKLPL